MCIIVEYTWESLDHQVTVMFHSRVYPSNPLTIMLCVEYIEEVSVLITLHSYGSDKIYIWRTQGKEVIGVLGS